MGRNVGRTVLPMGRIRVGGWAMILLVEDLASGDRFAVTEVDRLEQLNEPGDLDLSVWIITDHSEPIRVYPERQRISVVS
jgi:hypothetical protein